MFEQMNVVPADPCEGDNNQCNGNGRCVTTDIATQKYTCVCFEKWSGESCEGKSKF